MSILLEDFYIMISNLFYVNPTSDAVSICVAARGKARNILNKKYCGVPLPTIFR
jgi:hypothetical protein